MIWHAVFFSLDLVCLAAALILMRGAPGFWQKSTMAWYAAGFAVLAIGQAIGLRGDEILSVQVLSVGRVFLVLGVMAALFRLFYVDQERRCLKHSHFHK